MRSPTAGGGARWPSRDNTRVRREGVPAPAAASHADLAQPRRRPSQRSLQWPPSAGSGCRNPRPEAKPSPEASMAARARPRPGRGAPPTPSREGTRGCSRGGLGSPRPVSPPPPAGTLTRGLPIGRFSWRAPTGPREDGAAPPANRGARLVVGGAAPGADAESWEPPASRAGAARGRALCRFRGPSAAARLGPPCAPPSRLRWGCWSSSCCRARPPRSRRPASVAGSWWPSSTRWAAGRGAGSPPWAGHPRGARCGGSCTEPTPTLSPQGMVDTAKKNFGGGNTAWEEKTLSKYEFRWVPPPCPEQPPSPPLVLDVPHVDGRCTGGSVWSPVFWRGTNTGPSLAFDFQLCPCPHSPCPRHGGHTGAGGGISLQPPLPGPPMAPIPGGRTLRGRRSLWAAPAHPADVFVEGLFKCYLRSGLAPGGASGHPRRLDTGGQGMPSPGRRC